MVAKINLLAILALYAMIIAGFLQTHSVLAEGEQSDDGEAAVEEEALVSLKQTLAEKLQVKWSVEESVKASCCAAAFDLCERPPNMTAIAFNKRAKKNFGIAKKTCTGASSSHLNNRKQICDFYEAPMNCAMTPNTEEDFDAYLEQLPICCEKATASCKYGDEVSLYVAKKACYGFAARTAEQLCELSSSKDCQIV